MFTALLSFFAAASCDAKNFFGLPPWYKYLLANGRMEVSKITNRCEIKNDFQIPDLMLVGLAFVEIALRIAVLVAIGYVIYGGVQFVVAQGEADKVKKARQTIINALIGLVIAMMAVGMVSFIGTRIG